MASFFIRLLLLMFNIIQSQMRPPWVLALERAQKEYKRLQLAGEGALSEIAAWLLVEHVNHDLRLDGIKLAHQRVAELLLGAAQPGEPEEKLVVKYGQAVQRMSQIVTDAEEGAESGGVELTRERLLELHRIALGEEEESAGRFRESEINPLYAHHNPAKPFELPPLLDIALEWFTAPSLRQLHPVEQAALVHVRLTDLQPFGKANGRITRLAASFYTMRAGLPALIIRADETETYYQALLTGFQMATQPLVEVFARSLRQTLRQMIAIAH